MFVTAKLRMISSSHICHRKAPHFNSSSHICYRKASLDFIKQYLSEQSFAYFTKPFCHNKASRFFTLIHQAIFVTAKVHFNSSSHICHSKISHEFIKPYLSQQSFTLIHQAIFVPAKFYFNSSSHIHQAIFVPAKLYFNSSSHIHQAIFVPFIKPYSSSHICPSKALL